MRSIFVREKPRYGRRIAVVLGFLAGIAVVIAAGVYVVGLLPKDVVPVPVDESFTAVPVTDQERLGDVVFEDELPILAIPEDAATDEATGDFDPDDLGASSVRAYLATITVPSTEQALTPIIARDVWIVKFAGMEVPRPGSSPGDDGSVPTYSTLYVFVDAQTGDVLFSEWFE